MSTMTQVQRGPFLHLSWFFAPYRTVLMCVVASELLSLKTTIFMANWKHQMTALIDGDEKLNQRKMSKMIRKHKAMHVICFYLADRVANRCAIITGVCVRARHNRFFPHSENPKRTFGKWGSSNSYNYNIPSLNCVLFTFVGIGSVGKDSKVLWAFGPYDFLCRGNYEVTLNHSSRCQCENVEKSFHDNDLLKHDA